MKGNIIDNKITAKGVKSLCSTFRKGVCNRLTHLFIGGNLLGDTGIKLLIKNISKGILLNMGYLIIIIRFLDLSESNIDKKRMKKICKYIDESNQISGLSLRNNNIGYSELKLLTTSIEKGSGYNITYLDLSSIFYINKIIIYVKVQWNYYLIIYQMKN